ncbi:hypothetical protein NPIL_465891 [Nephila pilipes]|uniref:Uncharacterized protein n=1 Tax=Nephila pilipes TaxID=299642 RepID=A0A8X6PQS7_NEPPI|nr:hypothetical protein NPIL_465891 [Nephila pilipes]
MKLSFHRTSRIPKLKTFHVNKCRLLNPRFVHGCKKFETAAAGFLSPKQGERADDAEQRTEFYFGRAPSLTVGPRPADGNGADNKLGNSPVTTLCPDSRGVQFINLEPWINTFYEEALEAVKDGTQQDIVTSSETTVSVMDTYRESLNQCMNRGNHHLSEVQVARFDGRPRSLTEHHQIHDGVRSDERVGHGEDDLFNPASTERGI